MYMYNFQNMQHPRESADISVKPQVDLCYNIYVTPSIVVYSNYPGITTLQVRYYVVRRANISVSCFKSQGKGMITKNASDNPISL